MKPKLNRLVAYVDDATLARFEAYTKAKQFPSASAALEHALRQELTRHEGASTRAAAIERIAATQEGFARDLHDLVAYTKTATRMASLGLLIQWFRQPTTVELSSEQVAELKALFDKDLIDTILQGHRPCA